MWCDTTSAPSTLPPRRNRRVLSPAASDSMSIESVYSVSASARPTPCTSVAKKGSLKTTAVDSGTTSAMACVRRLASERAALFGT